MIFQYDEFVFRLHQDEDPEVLGEYCRNIKSVRLQHVIDDYKKTLENYKSFSHKFVNHNKAIQNIEERILNLEKQL